MVLFILFRRVSHEDRVHDMQSPLLNVRTHSNSKLITIAHWPISRGPGPATPGVEWNSRPFIFGELRKKEKCFTIYYYFSYLYAFLRCVCVRLLAVVLMWFLVRLSLSNSKLPFSLVCRCAAGRGASVKTIHTTAHTHGTMLVTVVANVCVCVCDVIKS